MDIYSLINSKSISAHCQKIAHQFTPLEIAYLVNENVSLTIAQKHEIFHEIIAKQPDMEVLERPRTPHFNSLHVFLQTYMELQNKYLKIFYQDELHCVYNFEINYAGDVDFCKDFRLYSDWDSCYDAIVMETEGVYKEYSRKSAPFEIRATKRWINHANDQSEKFLTVNMLSGNNPTDIGESNGVIEEKDNAVLKAFAGLWIEIPTPFQKGDILVDRNADKPFVLDRMPYWIENEEREKRVQHLRECGDRADLATSIYKLSKNGTILRDSGPNYLDLEYCKCKLEGVEEFLWVVSGAITGKIPLDVLLHSYGMIKAEQQVREEIEYLSDKVNELCQESTSDMKGTGNTQKCENDHAVIKDYWSPLVSTPPSLLFPKKFFDRIVEHKQVRRSKRK